MESIFGLFGLGCGLYCLYGYYLLKFKGEICSSILLPKDVNPKKCKDFPTLEEEALHNAIMEAMQKITGDNGNFVDAFRQNVIRVIGSYKKGPDEYDEKIKKKQDEMVALVMENAKQWAYTDEFDERYRKISDEINELKEAQKKENVSRRLAENYEQRVNEMDQGKRRKNTMV